MLTFFFAFILGVTKFVVTPLMLYLPVLISTITKMIIQNNGYRVI